MSFFGLFGNKKPTQKQISKHVEKIRQQYAQTDYRRASMEKLLEWNTKESIAGVLKRFSVVVQSPHFDEEEKSWLSAEITKKGELAKEAIRDFLLVSNDVSYPIRSLAEICGRHELVLILKESLKNRNPDDYRGSLAKIDFINALARYSDSFSGEEVLPYLDDHNDDVKCRAISTLLEKKVSIADDKFVEMLFEDIHSARVLRHVGAAVSEKKLSLPDKRELQPSVLEDFHIKQGVLKANRSK